MKDVLYLSRLGGQSLLASVAAKVNKGQLVWSSVFAQHLAKGLLQAAAQESNDWLRRKQALLVLAGPDLLKVEESWTRIGETECLVVRPKSVQPTRRIIYYHGGGYIVGSAKSYRYTYAKLALACDAEVVGVDYPLLPEHSLAQAQSSCEEVACLYLEEDLPVVLAGDSAGGGLCLEVALRLKAAEKIRGIQSLVLISPWVAPGADDLLDLSAAENDMLGEDILRKWGLLVAQSAAVNGRYRYDEIEHWEGLPPVCIQAGGAEVFLPQIKLLFESMKRSGLDVSLQVFEQQFHVFQTLAPLVREADQAFQSLARALPNA